MSCRGTGAQTPSPGPAPSLSQGRPPLPLRGNVLPQRGVGAPSSPPRGLRSHSLGRGTAECLAAYGSPASRSQADCTPGNSWRCVLADPASSWVVPRAGSSCLRTFVHCCSFHIDALLGPLQTQVKRQLSNPDPMPPLQEAHNFLESGSWPVVYYFTPTPPSPMRGEKSLPVGFKS